MALQSIGNSPVEGLKIDTEYLDAETAIRFLTLEEPEITEAPQTEILPPYLGALFENGASRDDALAAMRKAMVEDGFLSEGLSEVSEALSAPVDPSAFFDEIEAEYRALPPAGTVSPDIIAQNTHALSIFRIEETEDEYQVFADDVVIVSMPLGKKKPGKKLMDKIIVFVQTALDTLALGFALLGIGIAKGSQTAKNIANSLKKLENWLEEAKKAFKKFKTALKLYRAAMEIYKDPKKALKEVMEDFTYAFLHFGAFLIRFCGKVLRALLWELFGSVPAVIKTLAKLGLAFIEWAALGAYKVAVAVLEAIVAAMDVWLDVLKWQKLQ